MSALFTELLRQHGPFAALMPSPYEGRAITVTRRGGGSYEVRNLATLRDGAVDVLDWAIAFSRMTQRCMAIEAQARAENLPWLAKMAQATGFAAQQDCASAFQLSARWHRAGNLPLTRSDLVFETVDPDGNRRMNAITTPEELLAFGQSAAVAPSQFFARQRRANPMVEVDVELREPTARAMLAVPGLVGAAPLVVQGIILVGGVVTVAWVLRSTLAWIAPAAQAQAEAHEAAIEAIERTHRQRVRQCADLPPAEQAACLQAANQALLTEVDAANRSLRRGTIVETLVKVGALVAIGAIVVQGRRRG